MYRRIYALRKACYLIVIIINFVIIFSSIAIAERMTVAASIANIRSGPGTTNDILWQVGKYYPIFVIKKSVNWFYFRDFEGDKGWIHKSLLSKIPSVITNKKICNIRSGPSTKFTILFVAEKGVPFKRLKRKGNWINIQHADGDKGWIHNSLVW